MIIAIQPDNYGDDKRDSSSTRWSQLIEAAGHEVRWVDVYQPGILDQLAGCQGFMWRFAHFHGMKQIARRVMTVIQNQLGLLVYPDHRTAWHYDDKIAQAYIFEALDIPTARTWVFWRRDDAVRFAREAEYPLVAKLARGAASSNVRLVERKEEGERLVKHLFEVPNNLNPEDSHLALCWPKARGRFRGALRLLIKGLPEFTGWLGKDGEIPRNYVLFQEFIPGNAYDYRVVVVGDRAWGFRRYNRPGDFRASGGGRFNLSRTGVERDVLETAVERARRGELATTE